jgi:hypothetical protein
MRPTATAPVALVVPAGVLHLLPIWGILVVVGAGVVLTALQVIVTQVIRLRASARITSSRDALRVLEIEDLPRAPDPNRRRGHLREGAPSRSRAAEDRARPARQTVRPRADDEAS